MEQINNNFPWSIVLLTTEQKLCQGVQSSVGGEWFHCKVVKILTSFLWSVRV